MTSRIMVRLRRLCLLISTSPNDLFVRNLGIVGPRKPKLLDNLALRLASYLDKWLRLAKVEKTYEAICDFLARDQFLDCCSHELYLYLKP